MTALMVDYSYIGDNLRVGDVFYGGEICGVVFLNRTVDEVFWLLEHKILANL